jgi:hypothetical protein
MIACKRENGSAPDDGRIANAGLEEDKHVIVLSRRQQQVAERLGGAQQRAAVREMKGVRIDD